MKKTDEYDGREHAVHVEPNSGLVCVFAGYVYSVPATISWYRFARAILILDGTLLTYWQGVIHG